MTTTNPHQLAARARKVTKLCATLIRLNPFVSGSTLITMPSDFWIGLARVARCKPPSADTIADVINQIDALQGTA